MIRPVDVLLEFLSAEQARGITHVHLDEGARESLREIYMRAREGNRPSSGETSFQPEKSPAPSGPDGAAGPAAPAPRVALQLEENRPAPAVIGSVSATGSTPSEQLDSLRRQAENWSPAKSLGTLRDTMVFSVGNPEASLMLVGEAPGYQEEKEREPFVGPAGQKLNEILKAMGLPREAVYISNIVKFRPSMPRQTTNNRKPTPEEMASCMPFVRAEIGIVKPACIIAMGGTAAEGLLGVHGVTVGSMRNKWHEVEGVPMRVTYHPSYLLQSGGGNQTKRQVWEDMLAVMEKLGLPVSDKQRGYFLPKP